MDEAVHESADEAEDKSKTLGSVKVLVNLSIVSGVSTVLGVAGFIAVPATFVTALTIILSTHYHTLHPLPTQASA